MTIVQWVNLEKDEAYAKDSDIGSVDRCGALSLKALFEKDGVPLNFTVRAVPSGGDNVQYNEEEQKRNPNFRMPTEVIGLGSEKEVLLEDSVKLPAAGGNKYKLEAKDANGTTVESVEVEAKRKLYYQVLTMDDANGSVPAYSLAPMESHAEQHYIKLQKTGAQGKLPYRKTISMHPGGNAADFARDVRAAYNIDDLHKKVGFAAVFSDYIAGWADYEVAEVVALGASSASIVSAKNVTVTSNFDLWYGLDDANDAAQEWLVDAVAEFSDPASGSSQTYFIPRENVSIAGPKYHSYGGYRKVSIARDEGLNRLLGNTQGTVTFTLELKVVGGWTNGFSWRPWRDELRLITCSKRPAWEDMSNKTKEYTWNHEVGHRFGMVAYGNRSDLPDFGNLPDGPPELYNNADGLNYGGHRGAHCGKGATYDSGTDWWSGQPECVMFGANGIAGHHAPKEYCGDCAPIVRKLDLSG